MSTENWAVGLSTATSSFYSLKFTNTHTQTLQRVTKEHSLTATSATNPLKLRCCCYVYVHFSYLTPMEGVSVKCKWNRNKRCVTERAVQQICQSDYNWHPFWWLENYTLLHFVSNFSTNNSSTQKRWPFKALNHKAFISSFSSFDAFLRG